MDAQKEKMLRYVGILSLKIDTSLTNTKVINVKT